MIMYCISILNIRWFIIKSDFTYNVYQKLRGILTVDNGDLDLYVKIGRVPTEEDFDCMSAGGTASESCSVLLGQHNVNDPAEVFVLVMAYEAAPAATLTCIKGDRTTSTVNRGIPPLTL